MTQKELTPPRITLTSEEIAHLRSEAAEITRRHERGLPTRPTQRPPTLAEREARALAMIAEAKALHEAGRLAEALSQGQAAMGIAPAGSEPLADAGALVGHVRLQQGNPQAARTAFEQALQVAPAHMSAHVGLAAAYRQAQRPKNAVPLYLEALALTTEPEERRQLRGDLAECYREMGEADMARRVLLMGQPLDVPRRLDTMLLPASKRGWQRWAIAALLAIVALLTGHPWMALVALLIGTLWPILRLAISRDAHRLKEK